MKKVSRLGFLMKQLEVSGKELADQLSIDITTISKWKNNQRRMRYKSEHTRSIAAYLLGSELEGKRGKIVELLSARQPGINTASAEQLTDALCLWLSETDEPQVAEESTAHSEMQTTDYYSRVHMFTQNDGIADAIVRFFEYALKLPPGQEILMADYRDVDFDNRGAEFIDRFMTMFINAAHYGHTIRIIDCATDTLRPYLAVFRWMPMYLSENVEVWMYPDTVERDTRTTTFVLPEEIALNTLSVSDEPELHHGMLYRDKTTVDFFERSVRTILNKSKRLIQTVNINDPLRVLEILDDSLKSRQLTYMLNPMPTFRNMDIPLLRSVLESNGVDEATVRICEESNKITRSIRNRCRYRQIYDLDQLEAMVNDGGYIDYDLSAVCKKPIRISREHFRAYLKHLLHLESTEDYSITLTSFTKLELQAASVSLIVQDDSIVVAWDAQRFSRRMYCRELALIGGFSLYLEKLWDAIPAICKTDEWKVKQFNRMLGII